MTQGLLSKDKAHSVLVHLVAVFTLLADKFLNYDTRTSKDEAHNDTVYLCTWLLCSLQLVARWSQSPCTTHCRHALCGALMVSAAHILTCCILNALFALKHTGLISTDEAPAMSLAHLVAVSHSNLCQWQSHAHCIIALYNSLVVSAMCVIRIYIAQ